MNNFVRNRSESGECRMKEPATFECYHMRELIVVAGLLCLCSCQEGKSDEALKAEVLETDRRFSQMSQEKGIAEAFIYFADENVIKPTPGEQPVYGKFALMEHFKKNQADSDVLVWSPIKAEASGSLGYTFGGYTLQTRVPGTNRDTTIYGNYYSIWKRKKDGSWRYVLDAGNPTPGPPVLKR